jgi:hypothetical protein
MEEYIGILLLILIFGISVIGTIVFICCCDCDFQQKHTEEMDSLLDV